MDIRSKIKNACKVQQVMDLLQLEEIFEFIDGDTK
jgi:hypothetical protein|tara:strand:+ start:680 stop:784 length:105 start_codon:yes stop_codon:yes gene_type:complete